MKTLTLIIAILALGLQTSLAQDHKDHKDHDGHERHHEGESAEQHAAHAEDKDDHEGHDHDEHGDEEKARHGGIVAHAGALHLELVPGSDGITLYVEGLSEDQPVSIRLTLLQGKNRQQINMSATNNDDHRFEAQGDFHLASGDKIVALIRAAKTKPVLARFEMP